MHLPPGRLVKAVAALVRAMMLVTVITVTLGLQHEAVAQQNVEGGSFALQASINERPRLTRDQVDPAAVGAQSTAQSPFGGATVAPVDIALNMAPLTLPPQAVSVPVNNVVPPPKQHTAAAAASKVAAPALKANAASSSQDDLYSVDWSMWVTHLADRWFYNLKRLESFYGQDFHSPRAAQIRFTCYPNGTIGNISLEQSSGIASYDQLQIQSLVQTMPLAPFPPGTQRKSVTLVQGWESHPRRPGEQDFRPGSFGKGFPQEKVNKWNSSR